MHPDGKVFEIVGVYFKVKYLIMTIQSLSSTFKHNIFSTKSLANAPLINLNWFFLPSDPCYPVQGSQTRTPCRGHWGQT